METKSNQKVKLTYFDIPGGRGEALRLTMWIGKVAFDEERIAFKDWGAIKPTTKWASLPMLTLPSGQRLAQSRAVGRYLGKQCGLYPTDLIEACKVDEVMDALEDMFGATVNAGAGLKDKKAREAARKEVVESGRTADLLKRFEAYAKENGKDGHIVGDKLTLADIYFFCYTTFFLNTGFYDGVPTDCFNGKKYPLLQKIRSKVASHPQVVARYKAEKSEGPMWKVFSSQKDA
mmetsp:Transcript_14474/g.22003  ORF Transcript_14474/g.22003 Transcript_14474/m.22003 type:complete len:233 (-) Transcript_14474:210-908(-)